MPVIEPEQFAVTTDFPPTTTEDDDFIEETIYLFGVFFGILLVITVAIGYILCMRNKKDKRASEKQMDVYSIDPEVSAQNYQRRLSTRRPTLEDLFESPPSWKRDRIGMDNSAYSATTADQSRKNSASAKDLKRNMPKQTYHKTEETILEEEDMTRIWTYDFVVMDHKFCLHNLLL